MQLRSPRLVLLSASLASGWTPAGETGHAPHHRSAAAYRTARATVMAVDYYGQLGVARNAHEREIKSAYRQAARKWHPDVNPSEEAKAKFQHINEAYTCLSDKHQRELYDRFGEAGVKRGAPNVHDFNMDDIFSTVWGPGGFGQRRRGGPSYGPRKGDDLACEIEIDFRTACFGGERVERIEHLEAGNT